MTHSIDVARAGAIQARQSQPAAPMQRLDPYGQGGIAAQAGRLAPLAIVSLGYRQQPKKEGELGLPRATRRDDERWLHLHDPDSRAPGLAAALEAGMHRRLTIAFPLDEPRAFIQQTFMRWSASALEIYGDASGLYAIDLRNGVPVHRLVPPDHPDFARLVKTCKADTRIYFALAEWLDVGIDGEPQSRVLFPDGFGWYCFRTTGRHTAAEVIGYLENFRTFTRGRLAGIPFDLTVVFREVAGPDGRKRTVPVANIVAKPPEQTVLDSKTFRILATAGLEQGRNLQLPALPSPEEIAEEGPPVDEEITDQAAAMIAVGDFPCDYNSIVRTFHAIVRNTPIEADEGRAEWLRLWSRGEFDSLTEVRKLTQREATQMLADLAEGLAGLRVRLNATMYDRMIGANYDDEVTATTRAAGNSPPVSAADAEPAAESFSTSVAAPPDDGEAESLLAQTRSRNLKLLEDAEAIGVKGLRALKFTEADSLEIVVAKCLELEARIRSRNGELDERGAAPTQQERFG